MSSAASSSTTSMVTSDPDILAVGECVEHQRTCATASSRRCGTWRAVAATDSDRQLKRRPSGSRHSDQAQGLRHRRLLGRRFRRRRRTARTSCCATRARGVYKRVVVKDDRIVGAVLYGDTGDGAWYFDLLRRQNDISRDARHADLRPGLPGRRPRTLRRPLRPCRTMRRSAAATASARARSSRPSRPRA